MYQRSQRSHAVDFLFTISLFLVFAASSLAIILIASHAYAQTEAQTKENAAVRTSFSYLSQKIRQHDVSGGIHVGSFQETDALIMKQTFHEEVYSTYIYEYSGQLMELFIKDGSDISLKDGKPIMDIHSFSLEQVNPTLIRFSITDADHKNLEFMVGTKSQGGDMP